MSDGDDGGCFLLAGIALLIYGACYGVVKGLQHLGQLDLGRPKLWYVIFVCTVLGLIGLLVLWVLLEPWYQDRRQMRAARRERRRQERLQSERFQGAKKKMTEATERLDETINEIKKRWSD
jgi:heme exporter protein D